MPLCPETPIMTLALRSNHPDAEIQDMWYDWFCKDTSLVRKGRFLLKRLLGLVPSPRFNAGKCYAFFKNNCPLYGKLYDSFSICEIGSGDVQYWVAPYLGYENHFHGYACVSGIAPDTKEFESELILGDWRDVKAFFKEPDPTKVLAMVNETRRLVMITAAERENELFDQEQRSLRRQMEAAKGAADDDYVEQLEVMLAR